MKNISVMPTANSTIKSVLHHLQTNWCKVMTRERERTDATEAFYQAWVPNMTHIITFGRKLTTQGRFEGHNTIFGQ